MVDTEKRVKVCLADHGNANMKSNAVSTGSDPQAQLRGLR